MAEDAEYDRVAGRLACVLRAVRPLGGDKLLAMLRRTLDPAVAADLLAGRSRRVRAPAAVPRRRPPGRDLAVRDRRRSCSSPVPQPAVELRAVAALAIEVPALDDESIARIEARRTCETHRSALAAALDKSDRASATPSSCASSRSSAARSSRAGSTAPGRRAHTRAPRAGPPEPSAGGRVMIEIPFVNALGDAIERSAATSIAGRRPARPPSPHGGALVVRRRGDRRSPPRSGVFVRGTPDARRDRIALRQPDRPQRRRRRGDRCRRTATASRPAAAC